MKKCTVGTKHKWEWIKDRTVKSGSFGASGATICIARKGVFKCACGEAKYGDARTGFPVTEPVAA